MTSLKINENIINFILEQKCASICCIKPNRLPYCFSCYFAFNSDQMELYFKSSEDTNHIEYLRSNPNVAGTILPDHLKTFVVKGIQFEGKLLQQNEGNQKSASKIYHTHFPFALVMPGVVWRIEITSIKMTDSTKGFGTKILWDKLTEDNINV